jgi:hypothetical protein
MVTDGRSTETGARTEPTEFHIILEDDDRPDRVFRIPTIFFRRSNVVRPVDPKLILTLLSTDAIDAEEEANEPCPLIVRAGR